MNHQLYGIDNMQEATTQEMETNEEENIPLTEERLNVSKKSQEDKTTITKKTS